MTREDTHVSQMRKGLVELAVLGLLARGERYGQQLVDELEPHAGLAVSAGTVYPLLARLRKDGLIDSTWQESPVGPPRKYYRLTPTGVASLSDMSTAWRSIRTAMDRLLKESR